MKKYSTTLLLVAAFIAILVFCPSVMSVRGHISEGRKAPQLVVGDNETETSLGDRRGRYVLVDFWNSADGNSRLMSNKYNSLDCESNPEIERISVNFDRSKRLFDKLVERDNANPSEQYHASGAQAARIMRDFNINKTGYRSYLIDPNGRIEAINPTPEYLQGRFRI